MEPGRPIFSEIQTYREAVYKQARDVCDQHVKLAVAREQLKFNLKCKRQNVLPRSLIFQPPIKTNEAYNIASNSGR